MWSLRCERTGDVLPWWLQPSELCNTFLQLPLMFDGIGGGVLLGTCQNWGTPKMVGVLLGWMDGWMDCQDAWIPGRLDG